MIGVISFVSILMFGCIKQPSTVSTKVQPSPGSITDSDNKPLPEKETTSVISLAKILSAHDDTGCQELPFRTEEPWLELNVIVNEIPQPPWAGIRAATCMIELYPEASKDLFMAWMVDEHKKGLAYLLASNIDRIPIDIALSLVQVALAGPHAQGCTDRFMDSERSDIRNALP
ncbi:MAG: hypothetical protein VX278_22285 [Myxococcota bacterium]|nr:hypothetical protein [Myxococcota bacterium]